MEHGLNWLPLKGIHPLTLKNQIKAQNKKNNVNRAKKSIWADLLDFWLNLYRSLYHHRVHVWSCKLNNFFNITEHRIHMDETSKKVLYVDKWRKKQRCYTFQMEQKSFSSFILGICCHFLELPSRQLYFFPNDIQTSAIE